MGLSELLSRDAAQGSLDKSDITLPKMFTYLYPGLYWSPSRSQGSKRKQQAKRPAGDCLTKRVQCGTQTPSPGRQRTWTSLQHFLQAQVSFSTQRLLAAVIPRSRYLRLVRMATEMEAAPSPTASCGLSSGPPARRHSAKPQLLPMTSWCLQNQCHLSDP